GPTSSRSSRRATASRTCRGRRRRASPSWAESLCGRRLVDGVRQDSLRLRRGGGDALGEVAQLRTAVARGFAEHLEGFLGAEAERAGEDALRLLVHDPR